MKTTLSIIILFLCLNLQSQTLIDGQSYNKTDAYIGASMLVGTFIYYDQNRGLTPTQSNITAITGIGTSILTYYVISPTVRKFVIPKVKRWVKMKRNKSISKPDNILCEK